MGLAHVFPTHLAARTPQQHGSVARLHLTRSCYHAGNVQPTQIHLQHGHTQSCAGQQRTTDNWFLHWNSARLPRMKRKTVIELTFQKKLTAGIELTVWKLVSRKSHRESYHHTPIWGFAGLHFIIEQEKLPLLHFGKPYLPQGVSQVYWNSAMGYFKLITKEVKTQSSIIINWSPFTFTIWYVIHRCPRWKSSLNLFHKTVLEEK